MTTMTMNKRIDEHLRELRDRAPEMIQLVRVFAKMDPTKMSLGEWCQDFYRFRIYQDLGYATFADFLRGAFQIDPDDRKTYIKLRNAWMNLIRSYREYQKRGDWARIA
jgi:hypothetical protein